MRPHYSIIKTLNINKNGIEQCEIYHVVFDLPVTWEKNVHIMCLVAVESQLGKLRDYVLMQCIKESSTLRVGSKCFRPPLKIIYRCVKQEKNIHSYLEKKRD